MIQIKRPNLWLIFSLVTIVVAALITVIIRPTWGIDFVGGSLLELQNVSSSPRDLEQFFNDKLSLSASAQPTQEGTVLVRTSTLDEGKKEAVYQALTQNKVIPSESDVVRFESIGPSIGQELRKTSLFAVSLVVLLLIIYLAYEFRTMKTVVSPWKFGVAAVYALLHDISFVIALFVIFGKIWGATIDTLFVTAILTILGYSVNDTIILFHRTKTEKRLHPGDSLLTTINNANRLSLTRSLNTAFSTLLVLIVLLIFGGSTIRWFVAALTAGIITGTFSSLFVAPPMLLYLAGRHKK